MLKSNLLFKFFDQVKQEIYKITWPTKVDVIYSTMIVVVTMCFFSIFCLIIDYIIYNVIQYLLII